MKSTVSLGGGVFKVVIESSKVESSKESHELHCSLKALRHAAHS